MGLRKGKFGPVCLLLWMCILDSLKGCAIYSLYVRLLLISTATTFCGYKHGDELGNSLQFNPVAEVHDPEWKVVVGLRNPKLITKSILQHAVINSTRC